MTDMNYGEVRHITDRLIKEMVNMGLTVGEMKIVSESLSDNLADRIGNLHISSEKLIGPIA